MGTFAFMAPEQARGEPADARSDLFSIGALLYRGVYGHNVYRADNEQRARSKAQAGWVERPPTGHSSKALAAVIAKATAIEVKDRFQSAAALKDALIGVLRELPE